MNVSSIGLYDFIASRYSCRKTLFSLLCIYYITSLYLNVYYHSYVTETHVWCAR